MAVCKKCNAIIADSKAKTCPNCGAKVHHGPKPWLIFVLIIMSICILGKIVGRDDNTDTKTQQTMPTEYIAYKITDLEKNLEENPLVASDKYKNQYISLTGQLSTIDSDGKYFSIKSDDTDSYFFSISCYLTNNEQKDVLRTLKKGDTITVKGKVTTVGEVIGYSLSLNEIVKE